MTAEAGRHVPPIASVDDASAEWLEWANNVPSVTRVGIRCLQLGPGTALLRLTESPWALNPNGAVNGGLVIAAADQCMGLVAMTVLEPGALPATATLNSEFLRPAFAPLTFRASVTQNGRRLLFLTVDVEDRDQRLCVRCSGTMAAASSAISPGPSRVPSTRQP
jgi:uncharacterized protein (TIGR00369 family)